jgi:hypothetical protein
MLSVIERCCRTCAHAAPDHYRAAIRCLLQDRPVSARDDCQQWRLNPLVIGGGMDRRDIVVVAARSVA